jgi:hypothetical protein
VLEKYGGDQLDLSCESEKVVLRVKEWMNTLHEISKRKANWIGHILHRNCLLRQVIEGKIKGGVEVRGRRGRRRKKLVDDLKERRGYSHLKEEVLDRTMWRARFGRGFGLVRQTAKWMNEANRAVNEFRLIIKFMRAKFYKYSGEEINAYKKQYIIMNSLFYSLYLSSGTDSP